MMIDDAREALARYANPGVVYRPPAGRPEEGVITSVNDSWVFVRYGSQKTSAATDPVGLELARKVPGNG